MEQSNEISIKSLLEFLPSLSGKQILQLGSDPDSTKILSDQPIAALTVVDTNEDNLKKCRQANSLKENISYQLIKFSELNKLSANKSVTNIMLFCQHSFYV